MHKSQFHDLGPHGTAWTLESLRSWGALSKEILSVNDIEKGMTKVIVATEAQNDAATNSRPLKYATTTSKVVRQDLASAVLHDWLLAEAQKTPLTILVEDNLRTPKDYEIREKLNDVYLVDDEVIRRRDFAEIHNPDELSEYINESSNGYPLNAFVLPTGLLPKAGRLSGTTIQEISRVVKAIINSAYDGETYTLWQK